MTSERKRKQMVNFENRTQLGEMVVVNRYRRTPYGHKQFGDVLLNMIINHTTYTRQKVLTHQ